MLLQQHPQPKFLPRIMRDLKQLNKEVPEDMKVNVEKYRQDLIETIADVDEEVGEMFLMEEEITKEHLYRMLEESVETADHFMIFR